MKYPIKYIENNLVFNEDGECWAYYELIPFNYSFLSPDEKLKVHDNFRQLVAQYREGKIHALQLSTESSIKEVQERSKATVKGKLKDTAIQHIDGQTEALVELIGEHQVDYRFFIGFKLLLTDHEVNLKNIWNDFVLGIQDFVHGVNTKLMGDFVQLSTSEVSRFQKLEQLLENKLLRRFNFRPLTKDDFGYLLEHLHGNDGMAYEDYSFHLPSEEVEGNKRIKRYDLIKPTRCLIEQKQRYLKITNEDKEIFVAYFTINSIVGELEFPQSELFYYQQQQFSFPIDTSMNIEVVPNRKALSTVRNKKKELKDLDNHAWESENETANNVVEALDSVNELESTLDQTKESMYKLSYVIRDSVKYFV